MLNREDIEELETRQLSRLALKARESRGRRLREEPDALRTCFQRDRDRILHSRAFRRLQQKTQVFRATHGDHYRTRLTHTLEVAQLARSSCMSLGLNADVAESVALAHDLGHPPYGHVGERSLHERMKGFGGFRHNAQGLRILDELEDSYPGGAGLNLCWETRICLIKSKIPHEFPIARDLPGSSTPFLEGQIVDLCDRAAYVCHDLDDALRSDLIAWSDVAQLELPERALAQVRRRYPSLEGNPGTSRVARRLTISTMTSILVRDLVLATSRAIDERHDLQNAEAVRAAEVRLATHGHDERDALAELLRTLRQGFYRHPQVLSSMHEAADGLARLFEHFARTPDELPEHFAARLETEGLERTVCDYVAGMTDRFVERRLAELELD